MDVGHTGAQKHSTVQHRQPNDEAGSENLCPYKQFFIQASRNTAQFFVVFFAKFENNQDF
jgi:hypothetical protein